MDSLDEQRCFRPERAAVVPALVTLLGSLPLATTVPALTWLPLLPLAWTAWLLRARVAADGDGLSVCNGLRTRRWSWSRVQGVDVPRRGPLRLLVAGGARVPMTAVTRTQLPALLALGGGLL